MKWCTIPDFPAYEISDGGTVRKRDTGYRLHVVGRKVRLWDGGSQRYYLVDHLLNRAFSQPGTVEAAPAPDPVPDADELARLRARVAELEAELAMSRTPAAGKPVRKPAPKPAASVPPAAKAAKPAKPSQPGQKKRYCVVCGRLLPPGFWRRCPEHAFRDGVHTEDDFSGLVAL